MEVSSILEAFSIAYGWEVYRVFFLFLLIIGAPLYPLISITNEAFTSQVEDDADVVKLTSKVLWKYFNYFMVIAFALIPTVPLELQEAEITTVCGPAPLEGELNNSLPEPLQFPFNNTLAPFAPWLAMQTASGLRGVISNQLPCVIDITVMNQTLRSLNIDNSPNAQELLEEQDRFSRECHSEALNHYQRTVRGEYGPEARDQIRTVLAEQIQEQNTNQAVILSSPSSSFLRQNFYQIPDYCPNNPNAALSDFCIGLPIKSQGSVQGINSNDTGLLSQRQRATGETIPTCEEWYNTPDFGLADRLFIAALEASEVSDSVLEIGSAGRLTAGVQRDFDPLSLGIFAPIGNFLFQLRP